MKRYEVWISNFRLLWGNLTAASRLDQFGYSSQSIPLIFLICVGWRSWGRNLQIPCTVFRWKKFPVRKILLLNYSCSCQNETLIPWRSTVLLGPEMVCCTLKSLTVPICKKQHVNIYVSSQKQNWWALFYRCSWSVGLTNSGTKILYWNDWQFYEIWYCMSKFFRVNCRLYPSRLQIIFVSWKWHKWINKHCSHVVEMANPEFCNKVPYTERWLII